jgi:hypothetical protein
MHVVGENGHMAAFVKSSAVVTFGHFDSVVKQGSALISSVSDLQSFRGKSDSDLEVSSSLDRAAIIATYSMVYSSVAGLISEMEGRAVAECIVK